MLKLVSGSSSTEVNFEQLRDLYIPIPPGEDFDLFIDDITTLREDIRNIERQLISKRGELQNRFEKLYNPTE